MPPVISKEQKTKKVRLHFHEGSLEPKHVKGFFADEAVQAVYVVDKVASKIHYIHKSDKTPILVIANDSEVDHSIGALQCVVDYRNQKINTKASVSLYSELNKTHLEDIFNKTGHIHQPDYIRNVLNAFEKLESINQFDSKKINVYEKAIEAYEEFMRSYCKDILTGLGITMEAWFYQFDGLNRLNNKWVPALQYEEYSIGKVAKSLKEDSSISLEEIESKLEKGSDAVKTILTRENCDSIIQGISRLEWLLSLPKEQPIFSEYFRDNFYADRNPLIAYLLQMTAHVGGVKYDQIKRDLVNKGTEREQALIAELTKECERYLAHLETAQPLNIQEESRGYKKWSLKNTTTKDLKKILTDSNDSAFEKIKNFHTMFLDNKAALSQHRDSPTQLFLKRAAYILSSLFLGAGFIYSYVTNGTCNFFKSKGELMTDKIQSYLPNTSAPSH